MAYPINPKDIAEVTIRTLVNSQTCLTVLHYQYSGSTSIPDGGTNLNSFLTQLNSPGGGIVAPYAKLMAPNVGIAELRIQLISVLRFNPISAVPSVSDGQWPGEDCNNPAAAVAITKTTEVAARRGRGTVHMPGVPDESYTAGIVNNAYRDAAADWITRLAQQYTVGSGAVWIPVIYNRETPANSPKIVSCTVMTTLRTMRRRVVGRGI